MSDPLIGTLVLMALIVAYLAGYWWIFHGPPPAPDYLTPEEQIRRGHKSISYQRGPVKAGTKTVDELVNSEDD